jgi:hypothetical protein
VVGQGCYCARLLIATRRPCMHPPRLGGRRIGPTAARRDVFGVWYRQAERTLRGRTSPSRRPLHVRVEQRANVVPLEQKRTVLLDHGRVAKVVPYVKHPRRCCSRSMNHSAARWARPTNVPRLAEAAKAVGWGFRWLGGAECPRLDSAPSGLAGGPVRAGAPGTGRRGVAPAAGTGEVLPEFPPRSRRNYARPACRPADQAPLLRSAGPDGRLSS